MNGQGIGGKGFSGSHGQPSQGSAYGGGGQGLGNTGFSGTIGQPSPVSAPGPVGPSILGFNLSDINRILGPLGPEAIKTINDMIASALSRRLEASTITPPPANRPGSLPPEIPASPYAEMLAGGGAVQPYTGVPTQAAPPQGLLRQMLYSRNRLQNFRAPPRISSIV